MSGDASLGDEAQMEQLLLGSLKKASVVAAQLEVARQNIAEMSDDELQLVYEYWPFDEFAVLDEMNRLLPWLEKIHDGRFADLVKRVGAEVELALAHGHNIQEVALASWRHYNPRFSSMGVIDSDLQSETLKDAEELARR